jgi:ABC-type branched-subunit amino acid transport system substrate-binding protein
MIRKARSVESALTTLGVLALVVVLLAAIHALPSTRRTQLVTRSAGAASDTGAAATGDQSAIGSDTGAVSGGRATATSIVKGSAGSAGAAASCHGGATDVGVTATSIKLGATVVDSGIGSSFLGPVRLGMLALQKKINDAGGICGRKLDLVMKDDGWDRQRGRTFIQNLVEDEKVFALAVVPSSEGLDASADYIDQKGVPVVGSDGMLVSQYTHKWIWPVATSTMSLMHIIAKDAYDRGARHFSLVYDRKYRFGIEGAYAFNAAVKRLTGNDIPGYHDPFSSPTCDKRFCAIQAGAPGYSNEENTLRTDCEAGLRCDFNALLLEPTEAQTWYNDANVMAPSSFNYGAGGAQPLFTRTFASACGRNCDGLTVWSGFAPPLERFTGLPEIQTYIKDIQGQSANADVANQFLEGGYYGMALLIKALQSLGPDVTRARLKAALDTIVFDAGLTQPLTWAGNRFANAAAQGFKINYQGSFNGFSEMTHGWVRDPWVGQDVRTG